MSFHPPGRIAPGPGQESVWDYPRPPRVEETSRHITVVFNGITVVDTRRAKRVLETSHPPTYYLPPEDVRWEFFDRVTGGAGSFCEWKGAADYYHIRVGERIAREAAWSYPDPTPAFASIAGHVAIYAGRVDAAFVDGEPVTQQPGGFYGGWITPDVVGPFKGSPGTMGW